MHLMRIALEHITEVQTRAEAQREAVFRATVVPGLPARGDQRPQLIG
jgi:hypothetical protein